MALAFANLTKQYVTTNATTYSPATTFTPAARALLICYVCDSTTDTSETNPTSVSTNGSPAIAFSKLSTTFFTSAFGTITVWVADAGDAPSATQTLTVSGWGTARTGVSIDLQQVTGADLSGGATGAVVSTNLKTGTGTATSGSITLNAAGRTDNRPSAFFVHAATENQTQGTNWTLSSTGNYATPARGGGGEWRSDAFDTNASESWTTSAHWVGYALEVIAANPAPEPLITVVRQAVNRSSVW